jgi:hypothetical protein
MTTNGTAGAAHAESIIDNLLRLGVILLPEPERGVCWVADGNVARTDEAAVLKVAKRLQAKGDSPTGVPPSNGRASAGPDM